MFVAIFEVVNLIMGAFLVLVVNENRISTKTLKVWKANLFIWVNQVLINNSMAPMKDQESVLK